MVMAGGSGRADVHLTSLLLCGSFYHGHVCSWAVFAVELEANLREVCSLTITEKAFTCHIRKPSP